MEGETNIPICEKCNSLNVELDLSNGKINCRDCKEQNLNNKKIDIEKIYDNINDKQQKIIDDFIALGGQVSIKNNSINNPNQITNKNFYGTEKEY